MAPQSSAALAAAFALKSSTSMLPCSSLFTMTIFIPAIAADAGLVPCAEAGIRMVVLYPCPRLWWYARMVIRPVYSPDAPDSGCSEQPAKPVMAARSCSSSRIISRYPSVCEAGAKGCMLVNSASDRGIISTAAFSFMVHEPSGIMLSASEISLLSRRLM